MDHALGSLVIKPKKLLSFIQEMKIHSYIFSDTPHLESRYIEILYVKSWANNRHVTFIERNENIKKIARDIFLVRFFGSNTSVQDLPNECKN